MTRRLRRPRIAALLAVAAAVGVGVAGCADDGGAEPDLCDRLPGTDFDSEEPVNSVLGPEGVEAVTATLQFYEDTVDVADGDAILSDPWECDGNEVDLAYDDFVLTHEDGILVLTEQDGSRWIESSRS